MKRALAERAKQSLPNGVVEQPASLLPLPIANHALASSPDGGPPSLPPPMKIPRVDRSNAAAAAATTSSSASSSFPSLQMQIQRRTIPSAATSHESAPAAAGGGVLVPSPVHSSPRSSKGALQLNAPASSSVLPVPELPARNNNSSANSGNNANHSNNNSNSSNAGSSFVSGQKRQRPSIDGGASVSNESQSHEEVVVHPMNVDKSNSNAASVAASPEDDGPVSSRDKARSRRDKRRAAAAAAAAEHEQNHRQHQQQQQQQQQQQPRGRGRPPSHHHHDHSDEEEDEQDEEEEAQNRSAFYLKHQNSALATELKSLQHAVRDLSAERDYRRRHCHAAVQALNSLQATWTQLETALLSVQQLQQHSILPLSQQQQDASAAGGGITLPLECPLSTGSGSAVELTMALSDALAQLGRRPRDVNSFMSDSRQQPQRGESNGSGKDDDDEDDEDEEEKQRGLIPPTDPLEQHCLDDLSQISANVTNRAAVLQEWIWPILARVSSTVHGEMQQQQESDNSAKMAASILETATMQREIEDLKCQCRLLGNQVAELSKSRDDVLARERKIRRNVYRLAAGILTPDQVVKSLDDYSNMPEKGSEEDVVSQVKRERAAADAVAAVEAQIKHHHQFETRSLSDSGHGSSGGIKREDGGDSTESVPLDIVNELKGKLKDADNAISNRDRTIEELREQLKEKELRINSLSVKQRTEEDVGKLQSYESTRTKLQSTEKMVLDLQSKLDATKRKWSLALGNEKAALHAMEELRNKHRKRWMDFTSTVESELGEQQDVKKGEDDEEIANVNMERTIAESKKIIELEHKLKQALENVRQAETARENLKDALAMNESLQSKMEEFRSKYTALQADRSSSNSSRISSSEAASSSQPGSQTPKEKGSSNSGNATSTEKAEKSEKPEKPSSSTGSEKADRSEKLHRDHRRMRKELAFVMSSKEAAKAKLAIVEKERDGLMETNTRLLKQITEKDEMNARSLSTILHLKNMTEQLTAEKENLEQQAKSASQLALAARLATNAKERVSEEYHKEKRALEERVEDIEKAHSSTKEQLARITSEWAEASSKMTSLNSELANSLKRCDELVAEAAEKRAEIQRLMDDVDRAEREAKEAKDKLVKMSKTMGSSSSDSATPSQFTVEQLNTQISFLKSRLACPVCHYRDKSCIIMRCRHLHCRECVDERLTNRSRKCPTCNQKFADKDVEAIF